MLPDSCSDVLKALSDETRWSVVRLLLDEERVSVCDLATRLGIQQPTMSKHLRVLRQAGVVVSDKEGTTVWCRVTPAFRQRVDDGERVLDLGCCTFRFDRPRRS